MKLRWKLLANSRKAHLFAEDKMSLCKKFLYLGDDYDQDWSGTSNRDDCAACVKKAKQITPPTTATEGETR